MADELRRQLLDAHEQLAERDQEFRYSRDELRGRDEKIEALERDNAELRAWAEGRIAELVSAIESIESTRLWRVGARYRSVRDRLFRRERS